MHRPLTFLLSLVFITLSFNTARAQWVYNGLRLAGVTDAAPGGAISDGAGGAIIAWADLRGATYDIYARRISGLGVPLWLGDGTLVSGATSDQFNPVAVSDGAGGAIIAWQDTRNGGPTGDIYVQRMNAAGFPLWTGNGVALCTAGGDQVALQIASDGAGGAVVAWQDVRGAAPDIYARRVTGAGVPQWTADGVAVCIAAGFQIGPHLVTNGAVESIIVWDDNRAGTYDVYAQKLNNAGAPQWVANGRPVTAATGDQRESDLASDDFGGALVVWHDQRNGVHDIYAQRINGSGTQLWAQNGVPVCSEGSVQQIPRIVRDGAFGAIVAWEDLRSGLAFDVYAQRINGLGVPNWIVDGRPVCIQPGDQKTITLVYDGAQGAIATWDDGRAGGNLVHLYAQRVSANGVPMWTVDGSAVCTAAGTRYNVVTTPDGSGGIIAAWSDTRSGAAQPYAQRVDPRYGYGGHPEPLIGSAVDNPSDQGGKVIVRWTASDLDNFTFPGISFYSMWRATDTAALAEMKGRLGAPVTITDPSTVTRRFSGTAIWEDATTIAPTYWEWVGNLDATYQPKYSYTAPTRQDSTIVNPATTYFKVLAHESPTPGSRIWESGSASARSVDNIAPGAPLLLAIHGSGSNAVLTWKPVEVPDLAHYTLYRASVSGVQPIADDFLTDETLPNYTDVGAAPANYHYVVTATDIHGNESTTSNEVSLAGSTGVENTPEITSLMVRPNFPNPFSTRTEVSVGLPGDGDVSLELFDIAGRRVLSRRLGTLQKGWQKVAFDAVDGGGKPLSSGVYFYRVSAAGQAITNKLVIAH